MSRVASLPAMTIAAIAVACGSTPDDGTSPCATVLCAQEQVCVDGACVPACAAGRACRPSIACTTGVTTCATASAEPGCVVTGNEPDGTACGEGRACTGGACTAVDRTPPRIVDRVPAPGATNVWSRDPITVSFDEPMSLTSFNDSSVQLAAEGGQPVAKTLSLSADGRTLTITPLGSPPKPTTLVAALTTAVTDVAGNPLALPATEWSWSVPAWQSLGDVARYSRSTQMHPEVVIATDGRGFPFVARFEEMLTGSFASVHQWTGSWTSVWTESGTQNGALTLDVDSTGNPAIAWTNQTGYGTGPYVTRIFGRDGESWSELLSRTAPSGGGALLRFDGSDRLVAVLPATASSLTVERLESGTWQQLAPAPEGWTPRELSFGPTNQPRLAAERPPTGDATEVGFFEWDGSGWSAVDLFTLSVPTALPLQSVLLAPSGDGYAGWTEGAGFRMVRHRMGWPSVVGEKRIDLGTTFTSSTSDSRSNPVALDSDGLPTVAWFEDGTICGKRYDGVAWHALASDGTCTGHATGITAAVHWGDAGVLVMCYLHRDPYESGHLVCARYDE